MQTMGQDRCRLTRPINMQIETDQTRVFLTKRLSNNHPQSSLKYLRVIFWVL